MNSEENNALPFLIVEEIIEGPYYSVLRKGIRIRIGYERIDTALFEADRLIDAIPQLCLSRRVVRDDRVQRCVDRIDNQRPLRLFAKVIRPNVAKVVVRKALIHRRNEKDESFPTLTIRQRPKRGILGRK